MYVSKLTTKIKSALNIDVPALNIILNLMSQ